ncbi:MAG: hypothetical protein RR724_06310, partial [Hydrogenoanaerobacterium sp.]
CDKVQTVADRLSPLQTVEMKAVRKQLLLRVPSELSPKLLSAQELLKTFPGTMPVLVRHADSGKLMVASKNMWVDNNDVLMRELILLLGAENVKIVEK